jgi:L-ascorbate metabolism protein UlaG (beta-lactamase superfamily)
MKNKKMLFTVLFIISAFAYMHLPMFGSLPKGQRLERIQKSPNYKNGQFRNKHMALAQHINVHEYHDISGGRIPDTPIISFKTNIKEIKRSDNILIWFGHSSFFIQVDGIRFLFDPVFSNISSPILFFPKAFRGTNVYSPDDMPEIDYLVITHDHWDHLDYKTVRKLRSKVRKVICPLGVGAHLERWGFDNGIIIELDWGDSIDLPNFYSSDKLAKLSFFPTFHFSGRGFLRNRSLWGSFLVSSKTLSFFVSGDGGYNDHFKEIGEISGGVDLAIMECGQYNKHWLNIHMFPEETVQAALDLKAKMIIPAHLGKFSLSTHPWNEPLKKIHALCKNTQLKLVTPIIGEQVSLDNHNNNGESTQWWERCG